MTTVMYFMAAMLPTISIVRRCIDETIGENGSEGRRGGLALDLSVSGHVEFGGAVHSIGGDNGGR